MRTTGLFIVVTAVVGLSACRCNKSPGPQTLPSAQPVVLASAAPIVSTAPADAGPVLDAADAAVVNAALPPAILVVPLDFAPVKGSKFKAMKLRDDGTIAYPDKVVAKLTADKLSDDDGSPIATFEAAGKILFVGEESEFKFNDKDELEGPSGFRVAIADDGIPKVVEKTNAPPEKLTGKFVDFDPKARRAAAILLAVQDLKKGAKKAAKKAASANNPDAGKAGPKKEKDKKGKKDKKDKKKNKKKK